MAGGVYSGVSVYIGRKGVVVIGLGMLILGNLLYALHNII